MGCNECAKKIGDTVARYVAANFRIRPARRIVFRFAPAARFSYQAAGRVKTTSAFDTKTG